MFFFCVICWWFSFQRDTQPPQLSVALRNSTHELSAAVLHVTATDNKALDGFLSYDIGGIVQGLQNGLLTGNLKSLESDIPFSTATSEQLQQLKAMQTIHVIITTRDRAGNVTKSETDLAAELFSE